MRAITVMLLAACVLALACGPIGPSPDAKAVAERYFELRKAGQREQLMQLYSPEFFETIPREKFEKFLNKLDEKLGQPQSYELGSSNTVSFHGTSNSGTTTTMIYRVKYLKYQAVETLVVFQPSSGGPPVINGLNVQSEAFLE